jgi:CubicO group peptidase (beta-lactamase class C family)
LHCLILLWSFHALLALDVSAQQQTRNDAPDLAPLVKALQHPDPRVRENAVDSLGQLGPGASEAIEPLLLCLSDADPYLVGKAAEALSRIGAAAVPGLIRVLEHAVPAARWPATIALSKIGPDAHTAVPALTQALDDSANEVRWGGAVALGNIGPKAQPAVPALIRTLSDRDQDVRFGAAQALDRIDPAAMETHAGWQSIAATIDTLTPGLMKETGVPGVAIALVSNRTLVWSGQYGLAHVKTGERVTDETMFEACSMTKPVFGYLAMKLVESGKLELDRPLIEYLEPSSLRGQPGHERITARMVLAHTAGLPNWRKGGEERDGPLPVTFPPGSRFGYSGEGIYYLQRVVERITGEPLDVYARRALLDPMGLAHTSFAWRADLDAMIAGGHTAEGAFLEKTRYTHPNAAYTLYTSADDYARFLIELMKQDRSAPYSLRRSTVDTMLARQVMVTSREPIERPGRARGTAVYWGLGWSMNETAQGYIMHHSGANRSGFRCFSQFNPDTGSGIVIMTNGLGGSDLWTRLISRVGGL